MIYYNFQHTCFSILGSSVGKASDFSQMAKLCVHFYKVTGSNPNVADYYYFIFLLTTLILYKYQCGYYHITTSLITEFYKHHNVYWSQFIISPVPQKSVFGREHGERELKGCLFCKCTCVCLLFSSNLCICHHILYHQYLISKLSG